MVGSRRFDAVVVIGGLVVGLTLPLALGPRILLPSPPTPIARTAPPTPTIAPAVTFTPVLASTAPPITVTPVATPTRPSTVVSPATGTTVPRPADTSTGVPTPLVTAAPPPAVVATASATTPPPPNATATSAGPSLPPTASPRPSPTEVVYIVRSGDTIYSIGRTFGVSADAIVAANGMTDPNQLSVGQKLIIPPT